MYDQDFINDILLTPRKMGRRPASCTRCRLVIGAGNYDTAQKMFSRHWKRCCRIVTVSKVPDAE